VSSIRPIAQNLRRGSTCAKLRLEAAVDGGEETPVSIWAGVVPGVEPVMERLGIATAAEGIRRHWPIACWLRWSDDPSSSPCRWSARGLGRRPGSKVR